MRYTLYAAALIAGTATMVPAASAAPALGTNPAANTGSAVIKTQDFGIYIGPSYRSRYRDRYWDGYGYGYNTGYYYGPRRNYYNGYRYRDERRPFRRLQRRAP